MTEVFGAIDIPTVLERLLEAPRGEGVLSAYLGLAPADVQGEAYLLYLRDRFKEIRASLGEDHDAFEAAARQAEAFLSGPFTQESPGVAMFASASPDYQFAVALPTVPVPSVAWDSHPHLAELVRMVDDQERTAVMLFDSERARFFSFFLGEIEEQHVVWDAIPRRQASGGWVGRSATNYARQVSGMSQARRARHREGHILEHAQRAVQLLLDHLDERPFDRLIIGGPDEAVATLERELPRPLKLRLAGTVSIEGFAPVSEVAKAVRPTLEAVEREHELALVRDLLEHAGDRQVVLGLEPTFEALAEGRVHRLVSVTALGAGAFCSACQRLTGGSRCPSCNGEVSPVTDLVEHATLQALEQAVGAIEFVSGQADETLRAHGGLGAWTRY